MNRKKKIWIILLLAAAAVGTLWYSARYVLVDFQSYPRNAAQLDLRSEDISVSHYKKLSGKLPECEILWNVPFQGTLYPQDTREVTVEALTAEEADTLASCFPDLRTVHAEACTDYENLLTLRQRRPDVKVMYRVKLDGNAYPASAVRIALGGITAQELERLPYLTVLKTVAVRGGDGENLAKLREYCRENGIAFQLELGGEVIPEDAKEITVSGAAEESLTLLQFLPELESLHLVLPEASAEALIRLREEYPNVDISWEQEICGKVFSTRETYEEIDLSDTDIRSLDLVDQGMAYFPEADQVFLGLCGIDNQAVAAFRERTRDKYKVVWTVTCGKKLTARTDDRSFMPVREGVYYFNDAEAYNLRYCEDMVCIDIGHMSIHDVDFLKFMPDLEYLILAHTQITYIEPIRNCKKLKFLEVDWTPIKDFSPLADCTGLEDLNIGKTWADVEPLKQLTWLNNLWMVFRSASAYELTVALPDTRVVCSGEATVDSGWRDLPNYFAMRDELGMYYMTW